MKLLMPGFPLERTSSAGVVNLLNEESGLKWLRVNSSGEMHVYVAMNEYVWSSMCVVQARKLALSALRGPKKACDLTVVQA